MIKNKKKVLFLVIKNTSSKQVLHLLPNWLERWSMFLVIGYLYFKTSFKNNFSWFNLVPNSKFGVLLLIFIIFENFLKVF